MTDKPKALRGFAAIAAKDPERQREMARRGGAGVPKEKRSFFKNPDLAASAGAKGGATSRIPKKDGL